MKKNIILIIACAYMVTLSISVMAQEKTESTFKYDKHGNVESVLFSKKDREYEDIKSVDVFFKNILKVNPNNAFVKNRYVMLDKGHETFEQFYKGIKVEDAGYTFHYDEDGHIKYAHGNYVDISNLDINPSISKDDAAIAFAKYKGLTPDSITQSSAELIIKRIRGVHPAEIPLLVYKVTIAVKNVCVTEYGYVDAKTGDVEYSESYIYDIATTGTFYTKYYGTKYATTNNEDGYYYLEDPSRGNGIIIKDLNNYCMDYWDYQSHETRIVHGNNNWYYSDYTDSTFMAYDVNWAFQKIYDRFFYVHGKNSMDNNGKIIKAYVKAVFDFNDPYTDNACWFGSREEFYFGIGSGCKRPFSALDIVAHEYGHGITKFQIGWSSGQKYLNEGLSDIWAAIMDYRFGDANTEVWKIGEHLPPLRTCMRDLEYPENPNAQTQIASTYNSTYYSYCSSPYEKSGVFSHWFYLLVNGGQGYNSNGIYYNLNPIGMDVAENLIVKTVFDNYLRNRTSYEGVREAFVAAAEAMNINGLVTAVSNAWYAVGVGEFISGSDALFDTSVYTIQNLQSGHTVLWYLTGTNAPNFTLQQNTPSTNQCTITRNSEASYEDTTNVVLSAQIMYNGNVVKTITKTLMMPYIAGPSDPCGSTIYSIAHLPVDYSVDWSIIPAVNFLHSSILTTNSPLPNQCSIYNNGMSAWSTNLYAAIKNSVGDTIATFYKTIRSNFDLTFSQDGFGGYGSIPPSPVESNGTIIVNHKCWIDLASPYFEDMSIWHTGASPQNFDTSFDGHVTFRFPTVTSTQSMTIHGSDGCKVMQLHVYVSPDPNIPIPMLEVNPIPGGYEILLTYENDEEATRSLANKEWTLNVVNTSSNEKMFSQQIKGQRIAISTANWKQGVYVLQGIVDGQECTKKIVVK